MNRFSLAISILGLMLFSLNVPAQTSIPVDHKEPIAIHIVDGQDGHRSEERRVGKECWL